MSKNNENLSLDEQERIELKQFKAHLHAVIAKALTADAREYSAIFKNILPYELEYVQLTNDRELARAQLKKLIWEKDENGNFLPLSHILDKIFSPILGFKPSTLLLSFNTEEYQTTHKLFEEFKHKNLYNIFSFEDKTEEIIYAFNYKMVHSIEEMMRLESVPPLGDQSSLDVNTYE